MKVISPSPHPLSREGRGMYLIAGLMAARSISCDSATAVGSIRRKRMTEPNKILIIRLSAIGDVVFASPLIKALRRTYPRAHLAWLVEPAAAPLLRNNPDLDEVIPWPKQEWKRLWRERRVLQLLRAMRGFARELRAHGFDLALDLQGLMKSALWAYLSGAPQRWGLGSKEGSARLMTRVFERHGGGPRIGSEYFHLAQELGLDMGDFEMDVALPESDEAYALEFRARGPYAVICPFTTRPQKHWVEARWPDLAERIMERFAMPVLMLGGPADVEAGERISRANGRIVSQVGKSSLTRTAALIRHASLLVGVDTGLTHMGIAFNVPTLALFGSTCPYTDTTRANAHVLYHRRPCSPCRRNPSCEGRFDCMTDITIDEIMDEAVQVVKL